jgi:hypothetical protein
MSTPPQTDALSPEPVIYIRNQCPIGPIGARVRTPRPIRPINLPPTRAIPAANPAATRYLAGAIAWLFFYLSA